MIALCLQHNGRVAGLLSLLLVFFVGCGSNHKALGNKANGHGTTDSSEVSSPKSSAKLIDLIKPEFRTPGLAVPIEWKSDTSELNQGTCVLFRNQPFFPDLKQPNAWLNEKFDERMSIFVESCEDPEEDLTGGGFEGYFLTEAGRADKILLSLSTEITVQFPGGSTSHTGIYTYCFNPADGSRLALHDLFTVEKDSVYRMLKRLVVPQIEDQNVRDNAETIVFDGGLTLPEEALGTFLINSETLTIILHEGSSVQWSGPPAYIELDLATTAIE